MRFHGLKYPAALSAVLALAPVGAFAQSADASAAGDASGSIVVAQQQTYLDVMANLEASGYTIVETKSTFLGRVQIKARSNVHLREIVVSRATGEVKRDIILEVFATAEGAAGAEAATAARASGAAEAEASGGSGGLLGALGLTGNADVSAGANGSASGSSASDGSGSGGSLSGGVSGGLSGDVGIGR